MQPLNFFLLFLSCISLFLLLIVFPFTGVIFELSERKNPAFWPIFTRMAANFIRFSFEAEWEHSLPTNMAWVRVLASRPDMGWVCCSLPSLFLCSERLFSWYFLFSAQKLTLQIPIRSWKWLQLVKRFEGHRFVYLSSWKCHCHPPLKGRLHVYVILLLRPESFRVLLSCAS